MEILEFESVFVHQWSFNRFIASNKIKLPIFKLIGSVVDVTEIRKSINPF